VPHVTPVARRMTLLHPPRGPTVVAMSSAEARLQLQRLQAERLDAVEAGLGANAAYMDDLEADIASSRVAYVVLAVAELATLRAQLSGVTLEG
jgi:hypothetical protein